MKIHTHRVEKTIKRTLISMGILLVLAIIAGVLYTYFNDRNAEPTAITAAPVPVDPVPKRQELDPNAPESAAVQYIETPVKPGDPSSIIVTTGPDSECKIVVAYDKTVSKDPGLAPKMADEHGSVSWNWTVDKTAAAGKWPVKVTCTRNKKIGYVEGYQIVVK